MLGFLFTDAASLAYDDDALAGAPGRTPARCSPRPSTRSSSAARRRVRRTTQIEEALRGALIDGLGLKPRVAFGPAAHRDLSGRRVSPPLFESMELLGKVDSLDRIDRLGAPRLTCDRGRLAEARSVWPGARCVG